MDKENLASILNSTLCLLLFIQNQSIGGFHPWDNASSLYTEEDNMVFNFKLDNVIENEDLEYYLCVSHLFLFLDTKASFKKSVRKE